jgi:hypothetical protein
MNKKNIKEIVMQELRLLGFIILLVGLVALGMLFDK